MKTILKLFLRNSIMAFSLVTVFSCGPRLYDFSFELGNNRNEGECAILLKSKKGFHVPSNHIISKAWKTYHGPFKYPPNDLYTLYWIDENGDEYSAMVDLRTVVTRRFKGYLNFTIDYENNMICSTSDSYKGDKLYSKKFKGTRKTADKTGIRYE